MLVDDFMKQLEEHKGKELYVSTGWVSYKIGDVYDHKGECVIFLKEEWED